jgi:hypothetical protein
LNINIVATIDLLWVAHQKNIQNPTIEEEKHIKTKNEETRNRTYLYIFTHLFVLVENFIITKEASSFQFTIEYVSQNFILKIFVDLIIFLKKQMQTTTETRMKLFETKKTQKKTRGKGKELISHMKLGFDDSSPPSHIL